LESINTFGHQSPLTALIPDLKGIDPDDAFSRVPYEKGFTFLFYLETLVGIPDFEKFLRAYIEKVKIIGNYGNARIVQVYLLDFV
jgi:leukotriene-A4 hydrolase